jgi:hypothetical protein
MVEASGKKEERTSDPCPCHLPSMLDRYPWDQCLAYGHDLAWTPATVLEPSGESNRPAALIVEDFSSLKPIERVV